MSDEQNVKPGFKTTEFWLTSLAAIVGMVIASGAVPEAGLAGQIIGGAAAVLGQLGYSVSRAIVKKPSRY